MLLLLSILSCTPTCDTITVGSECLQENTSRQLSIFYGSTQPIEENISQASRVVSGEGYLGWSHTLQSTILLGIAEIDALFLIPEDRDTFVPSEPLLSYQSGSSFGAQLHQSVDGKFIIVGAPTYMDSLWNQGAIFFFEQGESLQEIGTIFGTETHEQFGDRLFMCGDLDQDGQNDVLIASSKYGGSLNDTQNTSLTGKLYIAYHTQWRSTTSNQELVSLEGRDVGGRLGHDADCQHDIDGDGNIDIVVSAPFADGAQQDGAGRILVYSPNTNGFGTALFELTLEGVEDRPENTWLGWSIRVGDLDGDSVPDIAAGAPGANGGLGVVYVWFGHHLRANIRTPYLKIRSEDSVIGQSLAIGDLNGDSFADLIVAEPKGSIGAGLTSFQAGNAHIFWGPLDGSAYSERNVRTASNHFIGPGPNANLGTQMAVGDINRDGIDDISFVHISVQ